MYGTLTASYVKSIDLSQAKQCFPSRTKLTGIIIHCECFDVHFASSTSPAQSISEILMHNDNFSDYLVLHLLDEKKSQYSLYMPSLVM